MKRSGDPWRDLDPRTPVLVGVGRSAQQLDTPGAGRSALDLITDAVHEALTDSGSTSLAPRIDVVAMPDGSWTYRNPGRVIADAIGAPDARTVLLAAGIPQQTLLDDAYEAVRSGAARVVLVAGGEAARRASLARRAGVALDDDVPDTGEPDELRLPTGEMVSRAEIDAGVVSPVEQFALIESALRAAEGSSIDEHRDEIAALWSGFSAVAAGFEHAAFRTPRTLEEIRDPGPDNRAMAFPYNKLHCSQMNVDQAAALLVCRLETAQQLGVDPAKVVFPLVALESSFSSAVPRRRDLHRWPSMEVLRAAAEAHLGHPLAEIEHTEVYSCFPAAVRVQQRALGLAVDGVPTVTGGEPFAGGPWNNFVLQATVEIVHLLRGDRGSRGLVTTVSGFLNKAGLAVYATEPGDGALLVADLGAEASAATVLVDLALDHHGPATVVAYTVAAGRTGDTRTIVVADTPDGRRCVATSTDDTIAAAYTVRDLIGCHVTIDGTTFVVQRPPGARHDH